jgi:hypothetical protein
VLRRRVDEEDFCMEERMVIEVGDGYPRRVREVMDVISCVFMSTGAQGAGSID